MINAISHCRACDEAGLISILDLGDTPLANGFLTAQELTAPEPVYSLGLALCPHCALAQLTTTVAPELLFREYLYFSSFSDTMLQHARHSATKIMAQRQLNASHLVLEIASNDGYLLRNFAQAGIPVLGVEPASNIARVATEQGVPTITEFFNVELAQQLVASGQQADVILANNVMAHVPDINSVVAGIKTVLKPDGIFVMETPYVKDIIDNLEFDTIYHEHVFYYSLTALENLFRRHGLAALEVERLSIHGGSLRVTVAHADQMNKRPSVALLLAEEQTWGVAGLAFYEAFSARIAALRERLCGLLAGLKRQGKSIAAYGASAKGATLLNVFGIGPETLDFLVDRSTFKQGRYTPGTHLLISPVEKLLQEMPDYALLLVWNFQTEILKQQAEYLQRGGHFIIPIPDVEIIRIGKAGAAEFG